MLQHSFSLRQFQLIKWIFFIHWTTSDIQAEARFSDGAEVYRLGHSLCNWVKDGLLCHASFSLFVSSPGVMIQVSLW